MLQSSDGVFDQIQFVSDERFTARIYFKIEDEMAEAMQSAPEHVRFVARSRLCRLGISVRSLGRARVSGSEAEVDVQGHIYLPEWGVAQQIRNCLLPGVYGGRLVFCNPEHRLDSDAISAAIAKGEIILPAPLSIAASGHVYLQPQACIYILREQITREQLLAVLAEPYGKELLDFLQIRTPVRQIDLPPRSAVITSCAMFLANHFVVLDSEDSAAGQHLQAVVLDPLETRLSRVFLEFENPTPSTIVNPRAIGEVFGIGPVKSRPSIRPHTAPRAEPEANRFGTLCSGFESLMPQQGETCYANRAMGAAPSLEAALENPPRPLISAVNRPPAHISDLVARPNGAESPAGRRGLAALRDALREDDSAIFCEYFPNLAEHTQLMELALEGRLRSLVFRHASFERGAFFSEADHIRMKDLLGAGVSIHWCNDAFSHISQLATKERRAFFVPQGYEQMFRDSLCIAVYGSTLALGESEASKLTALLSNLRSFLPGPLAFITGGGEGVMNQVLVDGRELGCLAGSNYLENAERNMGQDIHFYQSFQAQARHMRQRWFEVARFHIFCIGGIGTLEEIGLTLTDMKLGLLVNEPVVFFGGSARGLYWQQLGDQLRSIQAEGRGPAWLRENLLITDDPDAVIAFYRKVLQVT